MKRYHGHTLLYLHETVALGSGRWGHLPAEGQGDDRFTEVFSEVYHPMIEDPSSRALAAW